MIGRVISIFLVFSFHFLCYIEDLFCFWWGNIKNVLNFLFSRLNQFSFHYELWDIEFFYCSLLTRVFNIIFIYFFNLLLPLQELNFLLRWRDNMLKIFFHLKLLQRFFSCSQEYKIFMNALLNIFRRLYNFKKLFLFFKITSLFLSYLIWSFLFFFLQFFYKMENIGVKRITFVFWYKSVFHFLNYILFGRVKEIPDCYGFFDSISDIFGEVKSHFFLSTVLANANPSHRNFVPDTCLIPPR